MSDSVNRLPGGYIDDDGTLHQEFELRSLLGVEEELLANSQDNSAELVTQLLSRCVTRLGKLKTINADLARQLLVADRHFLMLKLRQLTFGDKVEALVPCAAQNCGKRMDLDFCISDIPIAGYEIKNRYTAQIPILQDEDRANDAPDSLTIEFRLPNGTDQEALADLVPINEAVAVTRLLSRCLLTIGDVEAPSEEYIRQLPASTRQNIELAMEEVAPNVELTMEMQCPECGFEFEAPLDLQDFFFGEIRAGSEWLFREVHYLAFHYHWSERDILHMPRERRQRYINVLNEQIESLNDAHQ